MNTICNNRTFLAVRFSKVLQEAWRLFRNANGANSGRLTGLLCSAATATVLFIPAFCPPVLFALLALD
jgi:hypothetical protein